MVHPEKLHLTPLPYIFQILRVKNVRPSVLNTVMDIIQNLLDPDNTDENAEEQQGKHFQ